jgi:hypothetical protein
MQMKKITVQCAIKSVRMPGLRATHANVGFISVVWELQQRLIKMNSIIALSAG